MYDAENKLIIDVYELNQNRHFAEFFRVVHMIFFL
jgi:hypothetical protein